LTDTIDYFESWKLKRNLLLLQEKITEKLEDVIEQDAREIEFHWEEDGKTYRTKSEILFISR
jgi:hypothetical protein